MEKFKKLTAQAAYIPIANIDTDMIIEKKHLKTIKRSGLGKWLFAELRYDVDGKPVADFILNQKPKAQILLTGENFGCGSSREHAPWSIMDFGIRVIIAPSFADIFYNNSYKNGLLLIKLDKENISKLAQSADEILIDLNAQTVSNSINSYSFEIESNIKDILLGGIDVIEAILQYSHDIKTYEAAHFKRQPWINGEINA